MQMKTTPVLWSLPLIVGFTSLARAQTMPLVVPAPVPTKVAPVSASAPKTSGLALTDGPLTLEQAIQIAFANHGNVSAAQQSSASAQQRITSARSNLYPQANVSVGSSLGQGTVVSQNSTTTPTTGTDTGTTTTTSTSYTTATQTNFGLSQTIFDAGANRARVRQAQANANSTQAGVGVARQNLAYTVASNFYEQLRQERLVGQRTQQVSLAEGQLAQIQAQIEAGTAARVDAQSVNVTLSQARFDLTTARNALDTARTNFRNALGLTRGPAIELREGADVAALSASVAPLTAEQTATALTPPSAKAPPSTDNSASRTAPAPQSDAAVDDASTPEATPTSTIVPLRVPVLAPLSDYVTAAQQNRPDLQQSRATILSGQANIAIAKAAQKPQVGLTAGYNLQNVYNSGRGLTAGLSLSLPLFDAGGRKADVRAARTDLEASQTRLTQLEKDVAADVEASYITVSGSVERIANAQALVESARANLEAATEKYRAGVGIVLDVVNAQTQFAQAQTSATTAIYDYQIALADLTRATGLFASGNAQTTPLLTDTTTPTPVAPAPTTP